MSTERNHALSLQAERQSFIRRYRARSTARIAAPDWASRRRPRRSPSPTNMCRPSGDIPVRGPPLQCSVSEHGHEHRAAGIQLAVLPRSDDCGDHFSGVISGKLRAICRADHVDPRGSESESAKAARALHGTPGALPRWLKPVSRDAARIAGAAGKDPLLVARAWQTMRQVGLAIGISRKNPARARDGRACTTPVITIRRTIARL
ncbi:hypothetical protein PHYPSEUDO_003100 [Phytophthora pseudosyringae]|uniref:Uncharacterized protein n=1 Tax=Phytophthora pseudosyringae TaxID=221518 RepID=A0A8T1WHS7_9STRA|nr:hypothetical protein PHYPSEUDO_003100 [Phytophthora pseudosyringae]